MSKLKKLLIVGLTACMTVCASIAVAACDKNSNYPNFREPVGGVINSPTFNGNYVISVVSAGGLPLDGVTVTVKKNGVSVVSGMSINGEVQLNLDPDEYDIEVDESTLPAGYYIPEGTQFKTEADKAEVTLSLPSTIISEAASSSTAYSLGDVMHDFTYTDSEGNKKTLSETLESKKAVVLNFWYVSCSACIIEFPAIQSAYESYSDKLEIVALSNQDSIASIKTFKEQNKITFQMAYDGSGVTNMFGVTAFPTTVIVDRYGVVAYLNVGSEPSEAQWKGLFKTYTSDDYVQSNNGSPDDKSNDDLVYATPDPELSTPDSALIEDAIIGEGAAGKVSNFRAETNENDAPYSWPWLVKTGDDGSKYITASNSQVDYSFAIIYFDVTLNAADALSFEYFVETETEADIFYVLINKSIAKQYSGSSEGWKTESAVYVADHTVTLEIGLCYMKDAAQSEGSDTAALRNIKIYDIRTTGETIDQRYAAVDTATLTNGKYDVTVEYNEEDNFYYIVYEDEYGDERKALLLADLINSNYWAEKHYGSDKFITPEDVSASASLYQFSFWQLSNYDSKNTDDPLIFVYDRDGTISELIIENYYLQGFSDNDLTPVTPELITAMQAFCKAAQGTITDDEYYEDQWLEFCFYYRHYGPEHEDGICFESWNPIKGLNYSNAFVATEGVNHVEITQIINLGDGGGINYTFVPEKTGVYYFYSTFDDLGGDPRLMIYDESGKMIATENDDVRYDLDPYNFNFYLYVELEAGKTYRVQAATGTPGGTGNYDMHIEYVGTYVEFLRVCTTGDGAFTWDEIGDLYYIAVPVALNPDDGYYHVVTDNNEFGSVVYIDFIHLNYIDNNNHTLLDWINAGLFDFSASLGPNYTNVMLQYYYKSIAGKDESDELYGMIEADETIVDILNELLSDVFEEGPEARAWLGVANYYEYYGVK